MTYEIVEDGEAIRCLKCEMTSWHYKDVEHKYCGNCHMFHEEPIDEVEWLELPEIDPVTCFKPEADALRNRILSGTSMGIEMPPQKTYQRRVRVREKVAIWLDDIRDPSSSTWRDRIEVYAPEAERVEWVKNYDGFLKLFQSITSNPSLELTAVFFDNDLGEHRREGRHAFNWMERYVHEHNIGPFELDAQTANPSARKELRAGFGALRRFWEGE